MKSTGLCKKVYNHLGKHGFSRLLLISIDHRSFPQSRSWGQWWLTTWQHKGEKQATPKRGKMDRSMHTSESCSSCSIYQCFENHSHSNEKLKKTSATYLEKAQRHVACWLKMAFLCLRLSPPSAPGVQSLCHNSSLFLCHANNISSWTWSSLKYMRKVSFFSKASSSI